MQMIVALILTSTLTAVAEEIEVKRLHSRHRRFIAPGARWDILAGFELLYNEAEVRFDVMVQYEMDYLFGGDAALAGALAGSSAAALAEQVATAAATAAVNSGASVNTAVATAVAAAAPGGRKKRSDEKCGKINFKSMPDFLKFRHGIKMESFFFFYRTSTTQGVSQGIFGRSFDNVLTRTLAHDQIDIYSV